MLHVMPQDKFLGVRIEVDLLIDPVGDPKAAVANPSCKTGLKRKKTAKPNAPYPASQAS
jgi:hypothetical protein